MAIMERTQISAILLAGGRSSRMQGRDKALVEYRGKPMIDHVLDSVYGSVRRILISYNGPSEKLSDLGLQVIPDRFEGFQGPLAGIASCLDSVDTDFTLVVPCDTPNLPKDLVARLSGAMDATVDLVHARDPVRSHPLIMLARTTLLASVSDYLARGGRSVMGWCELQSRRAVVFADASAFRNMNEMKDLGPEAATGADSFMDESIRGSPEYRK